MRRRGRFIALASRSGWDWLVEVSNHLGAVALVLLAVGVSAFSAAKLPHWWWGLLILAGFYVVLFGEGAFRVWQEAEAARLIAIEQTAQSRQPFSRSQQVLAIKALASQAVEAIDFDSADDATQWFSTTAGWLLASLGEGETEQFKAFDYRNVYPVRAREWLEELIVRADSIIIRDTFDPNEWTDAYT